MLYLHEIKSMTLLASGTKGKQKTPTPPHRLISSVKVPVTFLERPKEDFTKKYGGGKVATTVGNSLNKELEVKDVMMENIEKVLHRGEKIELLMDKSENLHSQALPLALAKLYLCLEDINNKISTPLFY
ncbi:unnamed protein product [Lactuca virosa]|uniref:V-SNARE coiled-coil homology domain-containing protein n=1 Tax=Lactuca virosa TaxID=75947 RepID=A0AAU9LHU2_9ASTR|nr:unnamed protein product [Lactuca virosa]